MYHFFFAYPQNLHIWVNPVGVCRPYYGCTWSIWIWSNPKLSIDALTDRKFMNIHLIWRTFWWGNHFSLISSSNHWKNYKRRSVASFIYKKKATNQEIHWKSLLAWNVWEICWLWASRHSSSHPIIIFLFYDSIFKPLPIQLKILLRYGYAGPQYC